MTGVTATVRVESPDLALTQTVTADESATVRPVSEAGTVPADGGYLFQVQSQDYARFERALEQDATVAEHECVVAGENTRLYRFVYAPEATLLSPVIARANGISLGWENEGSAWIVTLWLPDRSALQQLWHEADNAGIDWSLVRLRGYDRQDASSLLTEPQANAMEVALEMGYFEEPREASLSEVADVLEISQPAAGGLLRRATKRLAVSALELDQ